MSQTVELYAWLCPQDSDWVCVGVIFSGHRVRSGTLGGWRIHAMLYKDDADSIFGGECVNSLTTEPQRVTIEVTLTDPASHEASQGEGDGKCGE